MSAKNGDNMLCVFDFDGTLADSKSAYYKTVLRYASQHNFVVPSQLEMDMAFGNPNPPLFEGWGNTAEFLQHLDNIFLLVDDVLCEDPTCMPLFPKIFHVLETLKNEGVLLSIVTSRNLKPLLAVMDEHKITPLFKTIRSAQDMIDRGYRGKPHPDKLNCVLRELNYPCEKAVMVGDTFMDIKMAKNSGVKAVGVAWGYHDEATLKEHGADEVVDTPERLYDVIQALR
jgi:phosphoglycolate phosphatase